MPDTIQLFGQGGYLIECSQRGFSPATILDIGASIGDWASEMHAIWPAAFVTSIEANPACEPLLSARTDECHIACLSDRIGERDFWLHPGEPHCLGNSYYRESMPWFYGVEPVTVRTTTLSRLLGDRTFDFIKLDTQGSELDIIRGGQEIISTAKLIVCEVQGPQQTNIGAPTREEVTDAIRSLGYKEPIPLQWWYQTGTARVVGVDLAFWRE